MTLRAPFATLALAAAMLAAGTAVAQTHAAHTHGKAALDIAIERTAVSVQFETPLDNLLGFERAPKTPAERQAAEQALTRLRAADQWLRIDPDAGCKLRKVEIDAPALGQGKAHDHGHGDEHAELEAQVDFDCADATRARYIEVGLADTFKRLRTIDVQVAAPQGQLKRTLSGQTRRVQLQR
jgi:hypothetical protein